MEAPRNGFLSPQEAFAALAATPPSPRPETPDEGPRLELKGCCQFFTDDYGRSFEVVKDISFTVEGNKVVALLGPSGCGKSTILRMISGLYGRGQAPMPSVGEVTLNGVKTEGPRTEVLTVFQAPVLVRWQTLLGNVLLSFKSGVRQPRHRYPWEVAQDWAALGTRRITGKWHVPLSPLSKDIRDRSVAILEDVGLGDAMHKRPHQLSGGMRQRGSLATVLAVRPKVMCMDEPHSALDPTTKHQMRALLKDLRRKYPCLILLVTHDVSEALELADRVIVLSAKPATIVGDFLLPEERPANWLASPEYMALEANVLQVIREAKGVGTIRVGV